MYGGSWSLNGTMRIIFSLECPPSAKLLLESPDGAIKLLQLAQRSESSPKLCQRLWMHSHYILSNANFLISPVLLFNQLSLFCAIGVPIKSVPESGAGCLWSYILCTSVPGVTFCAICVLVFICKKCLRWGMALELYFVHLMSPLSIKSV